MPVFSVGFWNGLYHSPAMLREMAENFRKFSDYKPHGSINHEDMLACGRVKGVRFDGRTLFIDMGGLPAEVGQAWNAQQLHSPSIEYWDTLNDERARLMAGFRLPDGKPPGLVLRSVTLCGNQAPAVKNLGPMPKAVWEDNESYTVPSSQVPSFERLKGTSEAAHKFHDLAPASRRFSSEDFMDKATMIASLKAADPSLTDELLASLSDQSLSMLLDAKQGAAAAGSVADATPAPAGAPVPGAGAEPPPSAAMEDMDASAMMADCGSDPKKFLEATKKMADAAAANLRVIQASKRDTVKLEGQLKAIKAAAVSDVNKILNDRIKQFMDSCATRIPPAQRPTIEKLLRKCDSTTVRKFSDGSKMGSELEEEMAAILKQFPVNQHLVRQFSDSSAQTIAPGGKTHLSDRLATVRRVTGTMPETAHLAEHMAKRLGMNSNN
jgi:hypothetical protein